MMVGILGEHIVRQTKTFKHSKNPRTKTNRMMLFDDGLMTYIVFSMFYQYAFYALLM